MQNLIESPLFGIFLTLGVWLFSKKLNDKMKLASLKSLFNPVFLSITIICLILFCFRIDYDSFMNGGNYISFLLGPSVIAMSRWLFIHRKKIQKSFLIILVSIAIGSATGIISELVIMKALGSNEMILKSISAKSVTTPIAIRISELIGGEASLTAVIVIITGIFGAVIGPGVLKLFRIKSPISIGLSIGTASHGIGTARLVEDEGATNEERPYSTFSILAMIINGIITPIILPYILDFIL
jgi:predicted murein hydrolase (TIGR00659 family)